MHRLHVNLVLAAIMVFFLQTSIADIAILGNCQSTTYKFRHHQLILNLTGSTRQQRIYILHNISQQSIWLNRVIDQPAASAGWSSKLSGGHWSAFALALTKMRWNCSPIYHNTGQTNSVNCAHVLQICLLNVNKLAKQAGSFWISENQPTLKELMTKISQRKIN